MVIEADLAPGNDLGVLREFAQMCEDFVASEPRFVRMQPDAGEDEVMLLGNRDGFFDRAGLVVKPDGEHARDTALPRSLDRGSTIFGELLVIEMAVRVGEHSSQ